ncbi:MAG: hypothetical protein OXC63_08360 [Aestuariivita sp.]|nr:hypothetical protein [Aestuariivita sp.]MCY4345404.1 hypothetical protein [Aestuariivita sp.]
MPRYWPTNTYSGSLARPLARRSWRGLGLLDAILGGAVLSVLSLFAAQVVGDWATGRVVTNEARTVAELAKAGRLLIEGDITHAARTHPVGSPPLPIALSALAAAELRSATAGNLSPGRRTLSLHAYRQSAATVMVVARARGSYPLGRPPGAADGVSGVGVLFDTNGNSSLDSAETNIRGPGVNYDMATLNTALGGFAGFNDIFGFESVALDVACNSYLYRVQIDCDRDGTLDADANTMTVDIDMNDNDILGAGRLTATTGTINTLAGATTVTGNVQTTGDMEVLGLTDVQGLTVHGAIVADSAAIAGDLTLEDLVATGDITGADLTFTGTLTVAGDARLSDAEVDTLTVQTLNVDQLSADDATLTTSVATNLTVTSCSGCAP